MPTETQFPSYSRSTPDVVITPVPSYTPIPIPIPLSAPAPTSVPTTNTTPIPEPAQPPTPAPDITPPPPITGMVAVNAYDGKVNLWWDKNTAEDFSHYNIYVSQAELTDVSSMAPVQQIEAIVSNNSQITGLKDGTKYYFAVTAVDKNSNEIKHVTNRSATPIPIPRGNKDQDFLVDIYQSDKVWAGTTLLPDNHNLQRPRIIEVNMLGEIIWEYQLPQDLKPYTNPGFDVELLPNNNILLLLPRKGIYEIDRSGKTVWSYLDAKVSHDADRLPNGNTLIAFGAEDKTDDAQVKEVNPKGEIVWTWYAKDHFNRSPYKDIYDEGWLHTNAVTRLNNGNTLISPRNFDFVIEVNSQGSVIRTIGEGIFDSQHDPEVLPNGNILVANQASQRRPRPHQAVEINPDTGQVVWKSPPFPLETVPVRDANRLPNGNTLITGSTLIVEITPEGKTVWRLRLKDIVFTIRQDASGKGFYKAERIAANR